MSSEIVVLVPVLNRPGNALPLAVSLRETSTVRLLFLCSPKDEAEIQACLEACAMIYDAGVHVVEWEPGPGDYARKINLGVYLTSEPWILTAADDVRFQPGWAWEVMRTAQMTGKRVIGTNDLANPLTMRGGHATHILFHRSYIEELGTADEPGKIFHDGYDHQWVDAEAVATAQARGEWAFSKQSVVRHLHPIFDPRVPMDSTYERGLGGAKGDHAIFLSRRHLWRG